MSKDNNQTTNNQSVSTYSVVLPVQYITTQWNGEAYPSGVTTLQYASTSGYSDIQERAAEHIAEIKKLYQNQEDLHVMRNDERIIEL